MNLSLIKRLPFVWKFALIAIVLLAVGASYRFAYTEGYDNAETKAIAEYNAKLMEAKRKARENVVKAERQYEDLLREVQNAKDNELPVGPITSGAIDRLRRDRAGTSSE